MEHDRPPAKPGAATPAARPSTAVQPQSLPAQFADTPSTPARRQRGTAPPAVSAPSPALPKGGGAIRGLGEKFVANPVTGTGSLSIPIATSSGRNGFGPEIVLEYDSGVGNTPFGIGMRLSLPSITRKTDKGVPEYGGPSIFDTDVFILSGAEDLVPNLDPTGDGWVRDVVQDATQRIERYRPRVEGPFIRIERVTDRTNGNVYWRVTTKDNVTSIFGKTPNARIADPQYPQCVFSYLLERTEDSRGNVIVFEYKPEDLAGVHRGVLHETRRASGEVLVTNRYLKRIRYGNTTPNDKDGATCVFEVVFDYGEHGLDAPTPAEEAPWALRADPFSSYRATFEIRTYRLCRRVLMFHRFAELGPQPVLVRSTDFTYAESPTLSRLVEVTQSGYIKVGNGYKKKSLPPLELGYSLPEIQTDVKLFDPKSLEHLPGGVDGRAARWVDLDGEGIPGVLYQQPNGELFYKQNLGAAQLAPARLLTQRPSMTASPYARHELMDLAHEGRQSLVEFAGPAVRYHERTPEGGWGPAVPFRSQPNVNWNDPRVRFIDLTGDGFDDLLVAYEGGVLWYPSLGKDGYGPPRGFPMFFDENKNPALVLSDTTQSIFIADMTGDGLPDIVRIRNGSICYWPNMGYGRFGAKVEMSHAPWFDPPSTFDPRRIRLADIDGTGTADILYVGARDILISFNQSGNSWSAPTRLPRFPTADAMSSVAVLDLLGTGTSCLVWSSPWKGVAQPPMRYVDLLGSKKPYLLTSVKNNMGAETRLQYTTSAKFYLEDLKAGKPWITRLPFPVHVVERVEVCDAISKTRFVNTYKYHHGYYDGPEREFRGFGLVERYDTEFVSAEKGKGLFPDFVVTNDELPQPPVLTKMWFHTGSWHKGGERISRQFEGEYYNQDPDAVHLPDTRLPAGLSPKETLEACRALRGRILRQEVYGLDGSAAEPHPYKVSEFSYEIRRIQPAGKNPHGVFAVFPREELTYHYERNPSDPRIQHGFTLSVDDYGNVTKSAAVGYGRRPVPGAKPEQTKVLATYTESTRANEAGQTTWYRIGVPVESKTYELTGLPELTGAIYTFGQIQNTATGAAAISYETEPDGSLQKRLIERVRQQYYDSADLAGPPLAFGQIDALALPYQTYALAFNDNLIAQLYGGRVTNPAMLVEGAHADITTSGEWWVPSGREVYDRTRFYLPVQVIDPFNKTTTIEYDSYALAVRKVTDARNNVVAAENDYRTMSPVLVTEPNGNREAVTLDELGMVVATALIGKAGGTEGDTLDDPTTTFEYHLERWRRSGLPNVLHAAARERHQDAQTPWQHSYAYLDGMGGRR